jgi:hypothetical protein
VHLPCTGKLSAAFTGAGEVYLGLKEVCTIHLLQEPVDEVCPERKTLAKLRQAVDQVLDVLETSETRFGIPIKGFILDVTHVTLKQGRRSVHLDKRRIIFVGKNGSGNVRVEQVSP